VPLLKNTYGLGTDNLVFILRNPEFKTPGQYPKMDILGYYKKSDKNTIYVFNNFLDWLKKDLEDEIKIKNINFVSANELILKNVLNYIYKKLKNKLNNNLTNYEAYNWSQPSRWNLETELDYRLSASYERGYMEEIFDNEVFKFTLSGDSSMIEYDLNKDIIVNVKDAITGKTKNLISSFVGNKQKNYLVAEAYQKGVAPKVVHKMKELMDWFEDKKSVRLVLNDGTEYKLNKEPKISYLLKHDEEKNEYLIRDNYHYKPDLDNNLTLDKVKGFKYGNSLFELNKEDFEIPKF
jgi:hypothetical protein